MFEPATVEHWIVLIYEGQGRSRQGVVNQMIRNFAEGCKAVGRIFTASCTPSGTKYLIGITINPQPALVKPESGHGIIADVSRLTAYLADG